MESIENSPIFERNFVANIEGVITLSDNVIGMSGDVNREPMNESLKTEAMNFVFVKDGQVEIEIDGQIFSFEQGDTYVVMKNKFYNVRSLSPGYHYFSVEIHDDMLNEAKDSMNINMSVFNMIKKGVTSARIDENQMSYFESVYRDMVVWANNRKHVYQKNILKHFTNIFILNMVSLMTSSENKKEYSKKYAVSRQYVIFENFIRQLETDADSHRDVKYYADKLGVTPKYLSAVTFIYTGKSAIASIEDFVIERIKGIMDEQRYTIKQICKLMNFNSQSFFGRYFKRYTGMSPREYMMRNNTGSHR